MKPYVSVFPALAALAAGACATTGESPVSGGGSQTDGMCRNEPLGAFIGRQASAETAAEMLKVSGARTLRWVPPRTAVTMDFRADRLTVSYDDNMMIERASCG